MRLSRLSERIFGMTLMTGVLANSACNRAVSDLQTKFNDAVAELRSPPKENDKCVSPLAAHKLQKHQQVKRWVEMVTLCARVHDNGDRHRPVYCIDRENLEILSDIGDVRRGTTCEHILHTSQAAMGAFDPEIDGNVCYVARKTCQGNKK